MKLAFLLMTLSTLASSIPAMTSTCHHHDVEAYMPSQCPFVNVNTGFRCLGIPTPNGYYVGGEKYRCSNGHTWLVSNR